MVRHLSIAIGVAATLVFLSVLIRGGGSQVRLRAGS